MFDRLDGAHPGAGAWAREAAGQRVEGSITDFSSNATIQVSVCAVTLGWLEVLGGLGLTSAASAGLSLGEYAHLVDLGALDPASALDLVAARGRLYDAGPEGCMAAIFPAAWDDLVPLVSRLSEREGWEHDLAPAVFNSPSQTVVGGSRRAVEALMEVAEEELYAHGTLIEERVPMHTPRFSPVAPLLAEALEGTPWRSGRGEYWPNVTGTADLAEPERFIAMLTRHVFEPVRWKETVDALVARHPDGVFVEVGPRTVLRDLMARRWHTDVTVFAIDPVDGGRDGYDTSVRRTMEEVARAVG
jgi:[acyl-carrier-protein] S-malonyltransferase